MSEYLNILFLGDVYAKPGRQVIMRELPKLRDALKLDFVVANAENAAGGRGLTPATAQDLLNAGCDVLTLGNHTWSKDDITQMFQTERRILRPANYPPGTQGEGFRVYTLQDGRKIGVINLMGRVFMENGLDCPFQWSRTFMKNHELSGKTRDFDALLVDVHAEVGSEKSALSHIWNGYASLVVGSHTHVPTADARILSRGTGFQTDAGMCGAYDSIIGAKIETALARFEKKGRFSLQAANGNGTLFGVFAQINKDGLCEKIESVQRGEGL